MQTEGLIEPPKARDGFVIRSLGTGEEVHFMECAKNGRARDRVEEGLALKFDFQRYCYEDTRWADDESEG